MVSCESTFRNIAKHNIQKATIYDTVTKLPFKGLLLDNNKSWKRYVLNEGKPNDFGIRL
jgi:hypothetical protein